MKKIIIVLILLLFTGCNNNEVKYEANKVNLNDLVIEDKIINNYSTTNTSVIYDAGFSTFKTTLKNNGESTNINKINIIFKTKNNTMITTLTGIINKELKSNEETNVLITSDIDLTNAYSIEYNFE